MTFDEVLSANFTPIKRKFKNDLHRSGYKFDEDVFMDTYIKCSVRFKGIELKPIEYLKYFWRSYINNYKSSQTTPEINAEEYIEIYYNNTYDINTDILYNLILNIIREKFGDDLTDKWIQHVCYKKTYQELGIDYKLSKQIKRYVLKELPKILPEQLEMFGIEDDE